MIRQAGDELAAVIVEPILGAGGNIPGNPEFMTMLRQLTTEIGAVLIYDEVKTARLGPAGMQGMINISPDLTTLGKFIAGGLPTGAFGGQRRHHGAFQSKTGGQLEPRRHLQQQCLFDGRRLCCHGQNLHR